jgi:PRC-barrel domain
VPNATIDGRPHASGARSASSKRASGYAVFDPLGQKIGRVVEVFVNWDGEPDYIRIRLGFFGRKSVLIPVQFVEADDENKALVLK